MGLHSDPKYGAKTQLIARFPTAFFDACTLEEAARGVPRSRTVAVIDGNILAHQVNPVDTKTFHEYCGLVSHTVTAAARAAHMVVVAYDEPRVVTMAKREEQARRESAKTTPVSWERGDAYATTTLDELQNVVPLIQCRKARMRCLDEAAVRTLNAVRDPHIAKAYGLSDLNVAFRGGVLVYDGVDDRGASRDPLALRYPARHASVGSPPLGLCVGHGEADIKLSAVLGCVEVEAEHDLALLVTVDTDSICIELLDLVRRDVTPTLPRFICARQRAKRSHTGDVLVPASYQCIDVHLLFDGLVTAAWGIAASMQTRAQQMQAIVLCAVGFALSGCDFVRMRGLRADVVLDTLMAFQSSVAIADVEAIWRTEDEVLALVPLVRDFLDACAAKLASMPRMNRQSQWVRDREESAILKGLWTAAYWATNEIHDLARFGNSLPQECEVSDTVRWLVDAVVDAYGNP
jgi:hypothetical protein